MFTRIRSIGVGVASAVLIAGLGFHSTARAADAATVAARSKIFGPEHVNGETGEVAKDVVIFSWITPRSPHR